MKKLSNEVLEFQTNSFTTSSEYLGEFRLVLKQVLLNAKHKLSNEWLEDINKAIEVINKAFSS